jgi:hypothetical protein
MPNFDFDEAMNKVGIEVTDEIDNNYNSEDVNSHRIDGESQVAGGYDNEDVEKTSPPSNFGFDEVGSGSMSVKELSDLDHQNQFSIDNFLPLSCSDGIESQDRLGTAKPRQLSGEILERSLLYRGSGNDIRAALSRAAQSSLVSRYNHANEEETPKHFKILILGGSGTCFRLMTG